MLTDLAPLPKAFDLRVTKLAISTSKTVFLTPKVLIELGVDMNRFGERDYSRTQEIGSTIAWLGNDGLVAPSARWTCDNLMIFASNQNMTERLEVIDQEDVPWREWAETHNRI